MQRQLQGLRHKDKDKDLTLKDKDFKNGLQSVLEDN